MKKEINSTIVGIFPTPLYSSFLNRDFTKKEINFIKKECKKISDNNEGVVKIPKDTYILNNKIFSNLKKNLLLSVQDYFFKVLNTSNKIKPYINQSWINLTKEKNYHVPHKHPNSFLSGVLYIDTDKEKDSIRFTKDIYEQIQITYKEFNLYNSSSWWIPVEKKQIILFPSNLTHSVDFKIGTNERISLAFNVFIKGKIGEPKLLTGLTL